MNIMRRGTFAAMALMTFGLVAGGATAQSAEKYTSRIGIRIVGGDADPGRFDTLQKAGKGGPDYWCAAGEFVIRRRGLSPTTRIYLVQPLGRGRLDRNSIGFTTTASAAPQTGQSNGATLSTKRVGQNWTASHVEGQCDFNRLRR